MGVFQPAMLVLQRVNHIDLLVCLIGVGLPGGDSNILTFSHNLGVVEDV